MVRNAGKLVYGEVVGCALALACLSAVVCAPVAIALLDEGDGLKRGLRIAGRKH